MYIDLSGIEQPPIILEDGYYNYIQLKNALRQKLITIDISFDINYNDLG